MRPDETFVGQPIRSLQTMLRYIAESRGERVSIIPDGIYGQNTVSAVSDFQRRKGIAPTGVADQATWDAIAAEYDEALLLVGEPEGVNVILNSSQVIRQGEQHPDLYLAQAILSVLSLVYASVTPPGNSGILDLATAQSLASFQTLQGLPATGELDRITWHRLALHYPLAARLFLNPDSPKILQYS